MSLACAAIRCKSGCSRCLQKFFCRHFDAAVIANLLDRNLSSDPFVIGTLSTLAYVHEQQLGNHETIGTTRSHLRISSISTYCLQYSDVARLHLAHRRHRLTFTVAFSQAMIEQPRAAATRVSQRRVIAHSSQHPRHALC